MKKVTLTDFKDELAASVKPEGFSKKDVNYLVDQVIQNLKNNIAAGNEINFVGFGKWQVVTRKNVNARNPQSGETAEIPIHTRVVFRSSFFRNFFKQNPLPLSEQ